MSSVDARPTARIELSGRPLRILIGLEGLALGGVPINALDLSHSLAERGHTVRVFAIEEEVRVSILPQAELRGIPVTLLPSRSSTGMRARQISRLAAQCHADVIHVFAPWLAPAATLAALARPRRAAMVTNWMMENVDYAPQCTPMILGTRGLQEEAQRSHRSHVWLLEPPVNLAADRPDPPLGLSFRREVGIGGDQTAVVIVSRVDDDLKAEGIGYAIDAVAGMNVPGMTLVVVGDGNAFTRLAEQAAAANTRLGRRGIVMAGARQDPRPAYAGADICLGMGGSAIRSLAHGKPLIVLGENGFAKRFDPSTTDYFYRHGFFGSEVEPDPVGHLATQLRSTLDEATRRALGGFGLAEVRARFGLDASATRLEDMYRLALKATPVGPARWLWRSRILARAAAHETARAMRSSTSP